MFFTQDDYKKIQQWLTKNSVKDTEFNEANIPFNGEEIITIVQGNQNKKVFLKDLIAQVFNLGISDFVNITDKYDAPNISLEEAIRLIPSRARKEGQVITFLDREDHWHIYQFKGVLNQWNVLDTWEDLFDFNINNFIIDSILPDEEDLTKSLPDNKGNSYLSLKDREYNPEDFSGLGKVILRKNIVEVEDPIYGKVKKNILYQDMFTQSNTVYECRYDFDLNGQNIILPDNSYIEYNGGSISNGNIIDNAKGLNKIILRKNIENNKNILTQNMINKENTIYEIRYDFDLNGAEITIPEGCVLDFQGGSFNNGIIFGNNTLIVGDNFNSSAILKNVYYFTKNQTKDLNIGDRLPIKYLESNSFIYTITYHTEGNHSNNGIGALQLYISLDGLNFYNAGHIDIPNKIYRWDTSVCYYENKILIGNDTQNGKYEIAETLDLLHFNTKILQTPEVWATVWGGELYSEDNKLYFICTADLKEADKRDKHTYIMELDSVSYDIISSKEIMLPINHDGYRNYIDPFIIKSEDYYYLIIKDEKTTITKVFKSKDLNFVYLEEVNEFDPLQEGICAIRFNDNIYNYGDNFSWLNSGHTILSGVGYGTILQIASLDYNEISTPIKINIENNEYNRHSTFVVADTGAKRNVVLKYLKYNLTNLTINTNLNNVYKLSGQYDKLLLKPNSIYRIEGNVVINSFDKILMGINDKVHIELPKYGNARNFRQLTIKHQGINLPDNIDMTFNCNSYNTQILTITKSYNNELVLTGNRNNKAYYSYIPDGNGLYQICSINLRTGFEGHFSFYTKDGSNTFASAHVSFYRGLNDTIIDCKYLSLLIDDEMYYKIDGDILTFYVYKPWVPLWEFYAEVSNNHNADMKPIYLGNKDVSDKIKLYKTIDSIGGNTANRPMSPTGYVMYYDTTLNKPIWWTGSKWVDATGADV